MSQPVDHAIFETLPSALLDVLIEEHQAITEPRLRRLWDYYRNPARHESGGKLTELAQEMGLPKRLARTPDQEALLGGVSREVVIENDIAWRMHTHVDFMFGKPLSRRALGMGAADVAPSRVSIE